MKSDTSKEINVTLHEYLNENIHYSVNNVNIDSD